MGTSQQPRCPRVKAFADEPTDFDFLDFQEAERLLSATDSGLWRTMVLLALHTGLRMGELMGLQWSDLDLVKGQLRVRHNLVKGELGSPRTVVPFLSRSAARR